MLSLHKDLLFLSLFNVGLFPKPIQNTQKYHKTLSCFYIISRSRIIKKISQESWVVLKILTQLCINLKLEICHQTSEVGNMSLGKPLTWPKLMHKTQRLYPEGGQDGADPCF